MAKSIKENQSIGDPFVGEIDYDEIEKIMVNFSLEFSLNIEKRFKLDFQFVGCWKGCIRNRIQSKMER